jgi:hypothetical protein
VATASHRKEERHSRRARSVAAPQSAVAPPAQGEAREEREAREARALMPWARLWHDYSLTWVLVGLFLITFVLHTIFGWFQYAADQKSHNDEATVFGDSGYVVYWAEWTFQNWQSEFVQSIAIVVLGSMFIHKGSVESKDSQDQMLASLQRLEQRLASMEKSTAK